MRRLSQVIDEEAVLALRELLAAGQLPGLTLEHAMEFLLSDGIMPASGLPVSSFLDLEDWARRRLASRPSS